jgi:threonine aldolase
MNTKAIIDLRSDTFTKPCANMLQAIMQAVVGDDVFNEDPTTNQLEKYTAELFGYEAALFCTSGTMANQVALTVHCKAGDEVICSELSHIYVYEGGGIAANAGASVTLLPSSNGLLTADAIEQVIKDDNIHYPISRVVALENTMNKGGGAYYSIEELNKIKQLTQKHGLILHCDGARIMNALVASGQTAIAHGKIFDTLTICLSKGLGAPMGTVLLGNKNFIHAARRVRKRFGGGWRQSGYMAAAGLYALQNNISKLATDHSNAQVLKAAVEKLPYIANVFDVNTNIIILQLKEQYNSAAIIEQWAAKGVLALPFAKDKIRLVTHLDVSTEQIHKCIQMLSTD